MPVFNIKLHIKKENYILVYSTIIHACIDEYIYARLIENWCKNYLLNNGSILGIIRERSYPTATKVALI